MKSIGTRDLVIACLALSLGAVLLAACDGSGGSTPTAVVGGCLPATALPATNGPGSTGQATATGTAEDIPTEVDSDLPGPDAITPGPTNPPARVQQDDSFVIYNLVAHDLVTVSMSNTHAMAPPPYIAINPRPGKGELLDTDAANQNLPDDLVDSMGDLNTSIAFAPLMEAIDSLDSGGAVRDDGIYLTLGQLEQNGPNIQLFASVYRARDDANGYRYTLTRAPDRAWTITQRESIWDQ
jgi:hypothetical protein